MKKPKFKAAIITFIIAVVASIFFALAAFFTFLNDASIDINSNSISIYGYNYEYGEFEDFIDDYMDGKMDNNSMMDDNSMMDEDSCSPNGQLNDDYFETSSGVPVESKYHDLISYASKEEFDIIIDVDITNMLIENDCNYITDDQIDEIENHVESLLSSSYYSNNKNANEDKDDFIERQFTDNVDLEDYIEDTVRNY